MADDDDIYAHRHATRRPGFCAEMLASVLRVRWQLWLRSDACRMTAMLAAVATVVLFARGSSRELALELEAIDAVVRELASERPLALDLPVYLISGEEDVAERREVEEQLGALRPPAITWVPSVDGAQHLDEDRAHGGFASQTAHELGRTLSHLAAAQQLSLDGHAAALVVEGSAAFGLAPRWPFRLSELVAQLPATWTTLQLHHTADARSVPAAGSAGGAAATVVPYAGAHMSGTAAYVLSRRGAEALMRLTRAGRAVHRVALATRNGRTDTILYEFPYAEPWAVWPRYIYARPRARAFGAPASARQLLCEARIGREIVEHAHATWRPRRPGPLPGGGDEPDGTRAGASDEDSDPGATLLVYGDVISTSRELR